MQELIRAVEKLKNSEVSLIISKKLKEFGQVPKDRIFSELCYCLLTANFNAERTIKIQNEIGKGFLEFSEPELADELKRLGHRFPATRAKYIIAARKQLKDIERTLRLHSGEGLRNWLVQNIKGIGYKEASHFLRNIGFKDYAIIDFHIIDLLESHGLIEKPKTVNKNNYYEIEVLLWKIAKRLGLNLAELDLYLWYAETGKVLK